MKKLLLTLMLNLFILNMFAQSTTCYIIFYENTNSENMITHSAWGQYDTNFYRYQPHSFRVKQSGLVRSFSYANQTDQPDDPVVIRPTSFFETVEYLDWNSEVMNYSMAEFYAFLNSLSTYDKVYFIDRAEIKDGMMRMYPVKELKSRY